MDKGDERVRQLPIRRLKHDELDVGFQLAPQGFDFFTPFIVAVDVDGIDFIFRTADDLGVANGLGYGLSRGRDGDDDDIAA